MLGFPFPRWVGASVLFLLSFKNATFMISTRDPDNFSFRRKSTVNPIHRRWIRHAVVVGYSSPMYGVKHPLFLFFLVLEFFFAVVFNKILLTCKNSSSLLCRIGPQCCFLSEEDFIEWMHQGVHKKFFFCLLSFGKLVWIEISFGNLWEENQLSNKW